MKKIKWIVWSFAVLSLSVRAQDKQKNTAISSDEEKVYIKAISYGDYQVAKNALYELIIKHPEKTNYLDSLAHIYFSMNAYQQAQMITEDFLKTNPNDLRMLELCAITLQSLGNVKEALEVYEKVYRQSPELFYLYQMAVLQYSLKRYGECDLSIKRIVNDSTSYNQKVTISIDQQNNQLVPYAAAATNLRGVMQKDLNKPEDAIKDFESAIKIFPEFVLAKNNLEEMKKAGAPKSNSTK